MRAKTVLNLCDRFHCLPSELYKEEADLFKLLKVESLIREVNSQDIQ